MRLNRRKFRKPNPKKRIIIIVYISAIPEGWSFEKWMYYMRKTKTALYDSHNGDKPEVVSGNFKVKVHGNSKVV
jgi:hypothetical protein